MLFGNKAKHFPALLEPGVGYDPYLNPDDTGPVFALLGDSITAGCTPTNNGQINTGYWGWVQAKTGYRAYTPVFAGVGGNITTQMLARLDADVITPLSSYVSAGRNVYCLVMAGVNDSVNTSDIIATATGNLTQIYSDLIAAGITPIATTITPTTSATTATQIANWDGIQSWLRSYCPANGITLCDVDADCRDAAQTTVRVWNSGYTHDGVHPTAAGALAISQAISTELAAILPSVDHFSTVPTTPDNFLSSNPIMIGTGGSLTGTGAGVVADDWALNVGTGSKEARADNVGDWQVIDMASSLRLNPVGGIDISAGFTEGDLVLAQAEVFCVDDWDAVTQFLLFLEFRDGGGAIGDGVTCLGNSPNTGTIPNPNPGGIVVFRTIPATVPATCTIVRSYLFAVGAGGSIKVGRYEIKNLG